MKPDHEILSSDEWDRAHRMIAAWRNEPEKLHQCPRCAVPGIVLTDHSVRPYAEWYALHCPQCDLGVTMHLTLAPTPGPPV